MAKKRVTPLGTEENAAADASAFRAAVRDVKQMIQAPLPHGLLAPKPRARLKPALEVVENLDELMPLVAAASTDESGSSPLSFQRAGVRTQVMRRLRRGLYPAEDELDLHGMNQAAARDRLADFIVHSRDSGRRCVRIIHGKGYRSGARGPVLKAAVNLWLRRHTDVKAFTSARAIDGGTGAVYVLLRA
ncbi:MAG TPA: Smr/MutS family protein [Steroidobacteraceae bacterium]